MCGSAFIRKAVVLLTVTTAFFILSVTTKGETTENAAPVLLSTKGNAPKWKNVAQLRQFAAQGDPKACFELGMRYVEGEEVPRDPIQGIGFLEQAAKGGIADASFRLGKIYYDGIIVPASYARALDFYTAAARAGVFEAQHNIGIMLVGAKGVKRDYVEGLAWLIIATKSGAPSTVEKQVRARLAKYPDKILSAELRAGELVKDLSQATAKAELTSSETTASPNSTRHPVLSAPEMPKKQKVVIPLTKTKSAEALPEVLPEPKQSNTPATTDKP